MHNISIIYPVAAMAILTMCVWIWMYIVRIGTIRRRKIDVQQLANDYDLKKSMGDIAPSTDNFSNLFEIPVLFYTAAVVLFITDRVDGLYLGLAWGFVIFRYTHSLIHIIYNRVTHRFAAYFISTLALWLIWLRISWQLIIAA